MNKRKKKQSGFTLIELMIVIAIIAVLASIGLPIYKNHIAKAQATEGFQVTAGIRTDIAVFLSTRNYWPKAENIASVKDVEGKYIAKEGVTITGGDDSTSKTPTKATVINIKFNSGANSGKAMTITPTVTSIGQISKWVCASADTDGIAEKYLPQSCRE